MSVVHADQTEIRAPGFGVFMLRGMIGWLKALSALELTPTPMREMKHTRNQSPVIPAKDHSDVVNILANMVISCLGECT